MNDNHLMWRFSDSYKVPYEKMDIKKMKIAINGTDEVCGCLRAKLNKRENEYQNGTYIQIAENIYKRI
jgi:hypothetical protein